VDSMPFELCEEFDKLNLRIVANIEAMKMEVGLSLLQEIWRGQLEDEKVQEIKCNIKEEKSPGFSEDDEGVLWIGLSILVFYRRRELSFEVGDFVYLKVSSMRGLRHFKV
jgi:hypothetical protein